MQADLSSVREIAEPSPETSDLEATLAAVKEALDEDIGEVASVVMQCNVPDYCKELMDDLLSSLSDILDDFVGESLSIKDMRIQIEEAVGETNAEVYNAVDECREACSELRTIAANRGKIVRHARSFL